VQPTIIGWAVARPLTNERQLDISIITGLSGLYRGPLQASRPDMITGGGAGRFCFTFHPYRTAAQGFQLFQR